MKAKRIIFLGSLLVIGLWVLPPPGVAEERPAFGLTVYSDYHLNKEGRPTPSWDFIIPLYDDDQSLVFFNPRHHIDDETDLDRAEEWNLGLGYRRMIGDRAIIGANVFYDWRRSETGKEFEQVGAGLELMTENVTARVNGYFSLSDPAELSRTRWREYYFAPRSLNYNEYEYTSWEIPSSGFDGEIGFKVPYLSDYVETWVYGGGYVFEPVARVGDNETMEGVKGRIEVRPTDYLKASCEIRDDNVRGTAYYGEVAVELPFSIENLVTGRNPFEGMKEKKQEKEYVALADRMYDKVERDPDIITGYAAGPPEKVVNNGVSVGLVYVKNSWTGAESGTYANPYNTIQEGLNSASIPTSVLMILAGNTSAAYANKYGDFDVTQDYTTIWGQGYKPPGVTAMPHGLGASYPKIYGTANVDAHDVEIAGLSFAPPTDCGIWTEGSRGYFHHNEFRPVGTNYGLIMYGVGNFGNHIENNKFYCPSRGISVSGSNGAIVNNTFTITYTGSAAWAGSPYPGICAIRASVSTPGDNIGSSTDPLVIAGNTITVTNSNTNATAGPDARGIDLVADGAGSNIYALISGNTIKVTSTSPATNGGSNYHTEGIHLYADDLINARISGNTLSGGVSGRWDTAGLSIGQDWAPGGVTSLNLDLDILKNSLKVTSTNGNAWGMYVRGKPLATIAANIYGNTLSAGVTGKESANGIYLLSWGSLNLHSSNNVLKATSSAGPAYGMFAYGDTNLGVEIRNNDLATYGVTGYLEAYGLFFSGGANISPVITGNRLKVSSTAGDGFGIRVSAPVGNISASIIANDLSYGITGKDSLAVGISLTADNIGTSATPARIRGNKIKATISPVMIAGEARGIFLEADDPASTIYADISANNLSYGISGKALAYGIAVWSDEDEEVSIYDNLLKVTSSAGDATGIYAFGEGDVAAGIKGNDLSAGVSGKDRAWGIVLGVDPLAVSPTYAATLVGTAEGNRMKVSSSYTGTDTAHGSATGILMGADTALICYFSTNDMSAGISGKYTTSGVWFETASGGLAASGLSGNVLKVTSSAGYAYGLYGSSADYLEALYVKHNDMSREVKGFLGASGIYFDSGAALACYAEGNVLKVTSNYTGTTTTLGQAYGIHIIGDNMTGGAITLGRFVDNDLTAGISGKYYAYGISLNFMFDIGHYSGGTPYPVEISGNGVKATASAGRAYGIFLSTVAGDILTDIEENDLSYGITGNLTTALAPYVCGIALSTGGGAIGTDDGANCTYSTISRNKIKVTNTNATALASPVRGIYCLAVGANLHAHIETNLMTLKSYNNTTGVYLSTTTPGMFRNTLGGASYTYVRYNMGTVETTLKTGSRYLLYLGTGNPGGGNMVIWQGNTVNPVNGGWSGNYPGVGIGPVEENFTPGDTLLP